MSVDSVRNSQILKSLLPDVQIPECSLPEYIFMNFHQYPDRIAIECSSTHVTYTFRDVQLLSGALAANLRVKLNLQDDDIVSVILPNIPEFGIIFLGIIQANCICNPCNPSYTTSEIKTLLSQSDIKCIITMSDMYASVQLALEDFPQKPPILLLKDKTLGIPDGVLDLSSFIDPSSDLTMLSTIKQRLAIDVIVLPYSSGTTGLPKGVMLTQRNILANLAQYHGTQLEIPKDPGNQMVVPGILPFFHIYGLVLGLLYSLRVGYKTVTMAKFSVEHFIELIKVHKPDILYLVPPLIGVLIQNSKITEDDLRNVKIVTGSAPLTSNDYNRIKEKAPSCEIIQGYGLTETSPLVTVANPTHTNRVPSSIGGLIPNTEVKIVNAEGVALGPGESGELLIRGPQVMKGYYKNPDATQDTMCDGDWLKTGDMAHYDESQQIFITDRIKELIKVKGFQVPPAELEELLRSHPGVSDVAVIRVPHPRHGEAPKAIVIKSMQVETTEKDLQEFVAKNAAHYKRLTGGVNFVDVIPRSSAGKILRRQLSVQYQNTE